MNNHIVERRSPFTDETLNRKIDWDSATCIMCSTVYYQRLIINIESWFTSLKQMPLNRNQQLPAQSKRLIDEIEQNYTTIQ